jgi:hypothetical protein
VIIYVVIGSARPDGVRGVCVADDWHGEPPVKLVFLLNSIFYIFSYVLHIRIDKSLVDTEEIQIH